MTEEKPLPPLKAAIEAVQIQHEGKPMILLRDQEGINDKPIAVSQAAFIIASLLDGKRCLTQIQFSIKENSGTDIPAEQIKGLVDQLEKSDLLETPGLNEKRKKVLEDFKNNPVRKPVFVNKGYPSDKLELATFLGKFFKDPKGPGKELSGSEQKKEAPLGLVAPHIDYYRGGPAYAWSYQTLSECAPPDVIVGLGVAHMSPNSPWVLTPKSYDTPYGPLPFSQDLYDDIAKSLWYDPRADEGVHRTEHSLEFQALWLKYLWKEKAPAWVPILCSSFDRFCLDRAPSTILSIEDAINGIGKTLLERQKKGQKIMLLAGIDLSHVGPRFGDNEKLGPELNAKVEKEDLASLKLAWQGKADEMYLSVVKDNHWRKWCGLSAFYTFLRLAKILSEGKTVNGKKLVYGIADDPMGGIVSYTSAIFPSSFSYPVQ